MDELKLKLKLLNDYAKLPIRAHSTDSGLDLFAAIKDEIVIVQKHYKIIETGIAIELPESYFPNMAWEATIRPRSGLAFNDGISVHHGTIDSSFRGQIKILMYNFSYEDFIVTPGMKIAQLVIQPVALLPVEVVTKLSDTERAGKGFGSTGI